MKTSFVLICAIAALCNLSEAIPFWGKPSSDGSTLRLVHVLFRHGNRNPEEGSLWDGNPYTDESYYPEGWGQLTNKGKLTEYNLGKFYRERYDSFLGDTWDINVQEFRTTNYNRTKMSGLLVNAALWPPKGRNVWNEDLPWQPIPYNYLEDDELLWGMTCSSFSAAFAEAYASEELQASLASKYADALEILSNNTGISTTDYASAFGYFDVMKVHQDLGFEQEDWVESVFYEPLNSLSTEFYTIYTKTTLLKQILIGKLIGKIIDDSQSVIDGTISPASRKLFIYSAHDTNVGTVVAGLNGYDLVNTPPYGSSVLFELHEIFGVYGLKLYYIDYTEGSPHPIVIPGCSHFCPIDKFASLLSDIIPTEDVCNT